MVVCRSTPAKCLFFIAVKDGSRDPSPVRDYRYINDPFIGTAEDLFVIGQNNGIPPSSRLASPSAAEPPLNSDQVWVNTKSGKYWKPGSRYYGKTKQGEYMSEKEVVQKGYRPANGTGE
jgi:hypothetical protein